MAPPDPAQLSSNRPSIPTRTGMRRGPPIGPNTSIRLDAPVFALVKRFSNLPEHLHAAEAITVENVRNSWFPMMAELRNVYPEAFTDNTLSLTGHDDPIFQALKSIWPERSSFDINDRSIIIEFIIRSATEIGGRRTIRRSAARLNPNHDNHERQPRPLDFSALQNQENACRNFLFQKYSNHLNMLKNFYTNSSRAPTLPPIPTEMPESELKRPLEKSDEEPNTKKRKIAEDCEEELTDDETCKICYSAKKTHAFIHAVQPSSAHFICCESCAKQCNYAISGCPLCRMPVVAVTKIIL